VEETEASLVKERSGIDPDFQERSLTKRFVPARALSFFWDQKSFDPSSLSHMIRSYFTRWRHPFRKC